MFTHFSQFNYSRLIYQQPKKGAPKKKAAAAPKSKPKATPKAKPNPKTAGIERIERMMKRWPDYKDPSRHADRSLRGVTIGDKVHRYVEDVWEIMTLPNLGLTVEDRIKLYKEYSRIMASRGKKSAEQLQIDAFVAHMEASYEEGLVEDVKKNPKLNLPPKTHRECLKELRHLPFHTILEWYERSDANGLSRKGERDYLPREINLGKIGRTIEPPAGNLEMQGRFAVRKTVQHFLQKAGGKAALKRKWVTMIDDPKVKPQNASEQKHYEWLRKSGFKKSDISWQTVLMIEGEPLKHDNKK